MDEGLGSKVKTVERLLRREVKVDIRVGLDCSGFDTKNKILLELCNFSSIRRAFQNHSF